jgi:hypothetical protein
MNGVNRMSSVAIVAQLSGAIGSPVKLSCSLNYTTAQAFCVEGLLPLKVSRW